MLSFKDIKIIEKSLEGYVGRDRESVACEDKLLEKINKGIFDLLDSKFSWEISQRMREILPDIKIVGVPTRFFYGKKEQINYRGVDWIKMVNKPLSLTCHQSSVQLLADLIWSSQFKIRKNTELYQSDLYLAQRVSGLILECLKKTATPVIILDDVRLMLHTSEQ